MGERPRVRVLVVDDDPSVRNLLARLLTDTGRLVETAADGPSALTASHRTAFDLAMIDLRLPGLTGSELAALFARRHPDTAVIIASGLDDVATAVACMRAGACDYLTKPFDLDDVVIRVERALERRGLLLESHRRHQQLEVRARRETRASRRLFLGAIKSLSSALEAKDDYTRGHSQRVSRLAGEIARSFAVEPKDLRRLRLAGHLHDIGKIGVRESVLSKPAHLTPEEYLHVQCHPVIGERILAPIVMDPETVRIVRHHHEHYDGTGYPDGLRGPAIPFGARLLAVADAFDALTSDRPYRDSLTLNDALATLYEGSGSQWQPTIVEALARHMSHS